MTKILYFCKDIDGNEFTFVSAAELDVGMTVGDDAIIEDLRIL